MRKKTNRLKLPALLLALSVIASLTALPLPARAVTQSQIDELEDKRDELRDKMDSAQADIDATKGEHADALAQKAALDAQNELKRQDIELIDEQISVYTRLVEQKQKEADDAQTLADEQIARYRSHIRAMEENGSYTYITLIFGSKSLSELMSNLDVIGEIMESDKRLYDDYNAARDNAAAARTEYEETITALDSKQKELEEQKAALEKEIEAASQVIAALENDIAEYKRVYDEFAAQEAELGESIDDLIAALERQQQLNSQTAIVGTGSYIWPLPGYSPGSAYGWRMHPVYHEMRFHSGEDIGAPQGTAILAADSGSVILASYNGGYGNCVMINHGGGRVTLYGHMSSIAVSYGQNVTQGDVIGYVGSTGVSTGPHLHFEVRVDGATTDPKSYFSF